MMYDSGKVTWQSRESLGVKSMSQPLQANRAVLNSSDQSTPHWCQSFEQPCKKAKLPAWLDPLALPPVLIAQHRLNEQQVTKLLIALKQSTLSQPHAIVTHLRACADLMTLENFAWTLSTLR